MTVTIECLCGWRLSVSSNPDMVEVLAQVDAHTRKRHRLRTGMDVTVTIMPRGEPDLSVDEPASKSE